MEKLKLLSDEQLQQLALDGNEEAEDTLARRYGRVVKMRARSLFLVGGDGEDLIQEGMMGLLSAIRTYAADAGVPFATYAEICIKRRLINAIKSATRQKHSLLNQSLSLQSPQVELFAERNLTQRDLEENLVDEEGFLEQKQWLEQQLSAFEFKVLELFLMGSSYQEMADLLNKPQKSIDNAVQRIRKKLQTRF